jgi:hypothetical protein
MKKQTLSDDLSALRIKAEKKLKDQMERLQKLSSGDMRDLVHELGTHQIELEIQNEELRRAQEELEASRSRYSDAARHREGSAGRVLPVYHQADQGQRVHGHA